MPGVNTVQGSQPVEYVEETDFATEEPDAAYNWFGLVTSHSVTQGVESENVRYLPADGANDKLETVQNVKVSEAYSAEMTWSLQTLDELSYFTGTTGDTSDDIDSIQIGEQNEDSGEFRRLLGCVGEELTLTIEEDGVVEVTASFVAADATNWSETDYVDTAGSHASANTSEPSTYDDLSSVQLGGSGLGDSIESLTLTISNNLTTVKDPDAGRDTQIAAIVPTSREISVELALTYDDMSMADTVRSYTAENLTFDLDTTSGTNSFTVNDVQFPEMPYEFAPDDLVGDTVTSDPATGVLWS